MTSYLSCFPFRVNLINILISIYSVSCHTNETSTGLVECDVVLVIEGNFLLILSIARIENRRLNDETYSFLIVIRVQLASICVNQRIARKRYDCCSYDRNRNNEAV